MKKRNICEFVNEYLDKSVSTKDIVWSFSGVRPLFDDSAGKASVQPAITY